MAIKDQSVYELLGELASSSATPGGGSAAAVAGAMGAALVSMVCRLTIGKKRFAEKEGELLSALEQAETLRLQLTDLADADTQAFDQVMAAYRLSKETPDERTTRQTAIQAALQQATQVPLETAGACVAVLKLAAKIIGNINPNALSDAGAAALLAEAGLRAAQLNVVVNLVSIHDLAFKQEKQRVLDEFLSGAAQEKDRVVSYVLKHL